MLPKMLLRKCDFISPKIYLYYYLSRRHSSATSGIITLLFIIITVLVSYYFSKDFFSKTSPTTFFYKKYKKNEDKIYLNSSGIFHFLNFYSELSSIDIDKKTYTIIGLNISEELFLKEINLSKHNFWIYDLCEKSDFEESITKRSDFINDNMINQSFCIHKFYDRKANNIILKNDSEFIYPNIPTKTSNQYYGIYIIKCLNFSLLNNNSCYDNYKIEDYKLNIYRYSLSFLEYYVDVDNYKKPIVGTYNTIFSEFTNRIFSINHLNFISLELSTNYGFIINREKYLKSFSFDFNEQLIGKNLIDEEQIILGGFKFWLQNEINIYNRKYDKLQDIIGSVNGAVQMFLVFAKALNYFFYHNYKIMKDFNQELFNISLKDLKRSATFTDDSKFKFTSPKMKKSNSSFLGRIKMGKIQKVNILSENSVKSIRSKTKYLKSLMVPSIKKDIDWNEFFFQYRLKCRNKCQYINFITLYRKKILSEEQIYKSYFKIKNLKNFVKYLSIKKDTNKYMSLNEGLLNIQKFKITK